MTVRTAFKAVAALPLCCTDDWNMDDNAPLMPVVLVSPLLVTPMAQYVHKAHEVCCGLKTVMPSCIPVYPNTFRSVDILYKYSGGGSRAKCLLFGNFNE